jgi:hypothetical protein
MFVTEKRSDGNTYVTVPSNNETHSGSLLYISILRIFAAKGWILTLSTREIPKAVLETTEGAFFAGYVSQSLEESTGPRNMSTSKYARGQYAHQTFSVETAYRKPAHLRVGGQDKIKEALNAMKSFTKEYWGLRSTIIAIFKNVPANRVTHLETFFRSSEDIRKNIKTSFKYQNGGLLRAEELAYLDQRYSNQRTALAAFIDSLTNPTAELAVAFEGRYTNLKTQIDACDNEVRLMLANRSRIAFPNSKKKADIKFSKLSLSEKLSSMDETNLIYWQPSSLPGVNKANVTNTTHEVGSGPWCTASFGERYNNDQLYRSVIDSWYVNVVTE